MLIAWEEDLLKEKRRRDLFPSCISKGCLWIEEMRRNTVNPSAEQVAEWDEMDAMLDKLFKKKKITIEFNNFYDDFLHVFCCMQRQMLKRRGKQYATYFWDENYYFELWPEDDDEEVEFC